MIGTMSSRLSITVVITGSLLLLTTPACAASDAAPAVPGGPADPESIKTVHVVSMCHLDVGFTDTVAGVVTKYWHYYFPQAANTSSYLNVPGKPPQFVFTTHAWLLDMFFDCPVGGFLPTTGTKWPMDLGPHTPCTQLGPGACEVGCPSDTLVATVTAAIKAGGITWHAYPSNNEPESGDASLLLGGIDAVHRLDDKFGMPHKIVMSQRDVPGVTRSIVPLLRSKGVVAFSEGANGAFTSPRLPLLFNWSDPASGHSILYLNHPSGYGEDQEDGDDAWQRERIHRHRRRLLSLADTVSLAGFDDALIFAFRGDNGGPQTVEQALANTASAQSLFPNANVIGSTLDAFVKALMQHGTSSLPIVDAEVGDTWIYGLQADPVKTKLTRLMLRERTAAIAANPALAVDPAVSNMTRYLVKLTEHTFGETHGRFDEHVGWSNHNLMATLRADTALGQKYRNYSASWSEQRGYADSALDALITPNDATGASKRLHDSIQAALAAASPFSIMPQPGFRRVHDLDPHGNGSVKLPNGCVVAISHAPVAISSVKCVTDTQDTEGGYKTQSVNALAPIGKTLFQYRYQSLNDSDFTKFRAEYATTNERAYGKNNLTNDTCADTTMGCAVSVEWGTELNAAFVRNSSLLLQIGFDKSAAHIQYGAPEMVWMEISPSLSPSTSSMDGSSKLRIEVDLQTEHKTPTRIPEWQMLSFTPCGGSNNSGATAVSVDKLGSSIDALNVVPAGGVHLHSVGEGGCTLVCGNDGAARATARSLDTSLVSIGRKTAFPTPLTPLSQLELSAGVFFVLHDNLWDTNYPAWYHKSLLILCY